MDEAFPVDARPRKERTIPGAFVRRARDWRGDPGSLALKLLPVSADNQPIRLIALPLQQQRVFFEPGWFYSVFPARLSSCRLMRAHDGYLLLRSRETRRPLSLNSRAAGSSTSPIAPAA
jgi:hypothetical protein